MRKPAYALATVLILLGVVLFGISALVSISSLEAKISQSQLAGTTAYYAADAGISDGIWRLNNNSTYRTALAKGTLNVTYSASDVPQAGQGFTVTMVTSSQGAGYATITVNATSNNGTFTAQRQVQANVFLGPPLSNIGTNAVLAGGAISVSGGSSPLIVQNGDFFGDSSISLSSTTVQAGSQWIRAVGSYIPTNSSVTAGGEAASNDPPAPTNQSIPGIDFAGYQSTANATYTASDFTTMLKNAGSTVTLPGPITYVSGSVVLNPSSVSNKTINITGLLVINGSFTVNNGVKVLTVNVSDPGNGLSGLITSGSTSLSAGSFNVNGVVYSAGSINIASSTNADIQGALVSGGSMSLSPGSSFILGYVSSRATAVFGNSSTSQALQVQHWEESY